MIKWRKSSYSDSGTGGGNCVEVAALPAGTVGLRDTKSPERGHLTVSVSALATVAERIKVGEFDRDQ